MNFLEERILKSLLPHSAHAPATEVHHLPLTHDHGSVVHRMCMHTDNDLSDSHTIRYALYIISSLLFLLHYSFFSPVNLTLLSNIRLNPSHSVLSSFSRIISVNVCNFASILSACASAIASINAGFFGEPYSSSP